MGEILHLESNMVQAGVSLEGGIISPIHFNIGKKSWVTPYSRPTWREDDCLNDPPLLQKLGGDFFCFPFGVSKGIRHPHGETANHKWELEERDVSSLSLKMEVQSPRCIVNKRIMLHKDYRVLYQEHTIQGASGHFNYGHHPILKFPDGTCCPVRTSPFKFGSVYPGAFTDPKLGEYSSLMPGTQFESLESVALANGGLTSLAEYPLREGYEDLVMLSAERSTGLAWTAVTFPDYVWVSLRSVRQFPSTLLWISNGGRHQSPWNGRHRRRLGVEDVCSHFHDGCQVSNQDLLKLRGIKTSRKFNQSETVVLRHVQFVHPVKEQPGLKSIDYKPDASSLVLLFEDGQSSKAYVNWRWLLECE